MAAAAGKAGQRLAWVSNKSPTCVRHTARPPACFQTFRMSSSGVSHARDAPEPQNDTDAQVFRRIALSRTSARGFKSDAISDEIVKDILQITQRAPSSWNVQPWACVLVRDAKQRERMASAMLGGNARKVKEAPLVAVFCADQLPSRRLDDLMKLEGKAGMPDQYVEQLPMMLGVFAGEGKIAHAVKNAVTTVISPLKAMPTLNSTEAWSFKNTMPAMQQFVLAATAHGLGTSAMEGFDGGRLAAILDIPDRYHIPAVVCVGYSTEEPTMQAPPKRRYAAKDVFFGDKFGGSLGGLTDT